MHGRMNPPQRRPEAQGEPRASLGGRTSYDHGSGFPASRLGLVVCVGIVTAVTLEGAVLSSFCRARRKLRGVYGHTL